MGRIKGVVIMHISKSKIKTLEMCKRMFKLQHLDRKPPERPPATVTKVGIDTHDIFNKFYDNIKFEDIPERPFDYFKGAMTVLPQYQGIYDLFCAFQAERWQLTVNKDEFMPVLKEKRFLNNDESGIVDCVHIDGGDYAILDYKSSANNPSDLRFELNFYAKMVNDSGILDKPVKYISAYGYKDRSFFYEEINTRSYNLMLKKVEDFRKTDWEALPYVPTEGFWCNWCNYKISCDKERGITINTISDIDE